MYYFYKNTIITIRPGLGENNFATCYLKHTGSWCTVKSPAMPRVAKYADAVNNLHIWAAKNKLKKADCGCCMFCSVDGNCGEYHVKLKKICNDWVTGVSVYRRADSCDMMERFQNQPNKEIV